MLTLATKADLQRLIDEGIPESLTLDYKGSGALAKDSKSRDELCKDVSAFANSAGGQIVYGIDEKNNKLDGGSALTREWIEQVIDSNIQPRIEGLVITPIQLANGSGYVIIIPQATSRAPHQAPDKKYYKRQNFQSVAMEDYEIRDALRRATTPDLFVTLTLPRGDNARIDLAHHQDMSSPVALKIAVGNRAPQPAFHTIVQIGVHTSIAVLSPGDPFHPAGRRDAGAVPQNWFIRRVSTPPDLPIFQEANFELGTLLLGFNVRLLGPVVNRFQISTIVQTPGCTSTQQWILLQEGQLLTLLASP